jgi:hypothetical protein
MGHRAHDGSRGRTGPENGGRGAQDRVRVAQVAARLIAEHGITDWSLAKRKAVRQLMLPDRQALPGDDEIEAALLDYHALFGGSAHAARLLEQRREARNWMQRLAQFTPSLVGGVAAGWATTHSDIRLELVADDEKSVELALLNAGVAYRAMPAAGNTHDLYIDTARGGIRISVRTPEETRQRSRRDRHGNAEARLRIEELDALLGAGDTIP